MITYYLNGGDNNSFISVRAVVLIKYSLCALTAFVLFAEFK